MKKNRIVYFDYLRVFSIVAVILLHVAAQNWGTLSGRSFEWNVFNFYDGIVRWCVPVFLMISGALFLEREMEIKTLYSKYILRLVSAYCAWSLLYAIATPIGKVLLNTDYKISYKSILSDWIGGEFHMWFIPMIISIYMCIPLIKQIVRSEEITKYFLTLSGLFTFVIPQVVKMSDDFVGGFFSAGIHKVNDVLSNMSMSLVLGYSFYFILGYVLSKAELTKKLRNIVYILGIIGFLSTVLLNAVVAWKTGEPCHTYYGNFTVNVALESIAVFTWFKYRDYKNEKLNHIMLQLSKYSFGAYLVHIFGLNLLKAIGLNTMAFAPVISVPSIAAILVVISFAISFVLNKIPKLNRWIV